MKGRCPYSTSHAICLGLMLKAILTCADKYYVQPSIQEKMMIITPMYCFTFYERIFYIAINIDGKISILKTLRYSFNNIIGEHNVCVVNVLNINTHSLYNRFGLKKVDAKGS